MYGRGLRSIRTRFTLLVALCTAAGVAAIVAACVAAFLCFAATGPISRIRGPSFVAAAR